MAREPEAPTAATAKPEAAQGTSTAKKPAEAVKATASTVAAPSKTYDFDVVVLGAGPGGYTAAFRAADLGLKVALVERWPMLGGVCLNVGCIPSKALLHAAKVIEEARAMADFGVSFGAPSVDAEKLRRWKNKIVTRLTGGLSGLAKQRKVTVLRGVGSFASDHTVDVTPETGSPQTVSFAHCIIAVGSESMRLPGLPDDPRIIDSTGALELELPGSLLVVGGGIIGLEMATVYAALGVQVSVVELTEGLMPGCDRDLVKPLEKRITPHYERIMLRTKVTTIAAEKKGLRVTFEGEKAPEPQLYDKVLIAVGRTPNGKLINCEAAGVAVDATRLHHGGQAVAHQRAAHLCDRRRRRASRCWRTRRRMKRRWRRRWQRATSGNSTRGRSLRSRTPIRRSPGRA